MQFYTFPSCNLKHFRNPQRIDFLVQDAVNGTGSV